MNAAELLNNTLSPDQATRESATKQLEAAERSNFHGYLHTLAAELANESQPDHIRTAAGLAFKNALAARNAVNQPVLSERWLSLPATATTPLKQSLLSTLGSPSHRAGAVAAQAVSAVAAVELPASRWPELIQTLLEFVGNQDNTNLRVATLQAIGYICEVIPPEVLATRSNEILTAVVQGARKEEPSSDVQAAAIHALYNSLEFIRDNFEREGERNYIMQVVCEATQNASVTVQVGAFECLVRIMSEYYEKMDFYMERALFGLTIMGMRHQEEAVALQAIEFWSTVSEQEIEIAVEAQEAEEYGEQPAVQSRHFAKMALAEVLPVLLDLLTQQDEDADEDDWTKSMAAASCLELLARNVTDDIVQPVVPFVEAGIQRPEWQNREAAVMAFGAILDGPEPATLAGLVRQALPGLIEMLRNDPSVPVKDTVAYTLSKITDVMLEIIDPSEQLEALVTALVFGLSISPRVAISCCSALSNLMSQLCQPPDFIGEAPATSCMSKYFSGVLNALMPLSEKPSNDANSRSAAYQTIATFVASSPKDTFPVVQEVAVTMLARQEALLGMQNQLVGADDRNNWNDMQISICAVLQSVIHKAPEIMSPFADRIMTNLLNLLSSSGKQSGVLEDAFATIGALASALDARFNNYMEAFAPFLFTALGSLEEHQVVQAGIYVASDIARAINEAIAPYAERIMVALVEILRSPAVYRTVKPSAITTIGEVALAIGSGFVPYLETTMGILSQAGSAAAGNDPSLIEFVWSMREAIVDAFIGIMNGLRASDPAPFQPYVSGIMQFLRQGFEDPNSTEQYLTSTLGLIGDFADTYKGAIRDDLMQDWVSQNIQQGRGRGSSQQTRVNAAYAQKAIKEATK